MQLSIIIPFHEIIDELNDMLNCVSKQLTSDDELLLIGDGISEEIITELKKKFERDNVKIISQPKLGANVIRQYGVSMARGKYILFHDSDDLLPDNTLEYYKSIIVKDEPDIIIGNIRHVVKGQVLYNFQRSGMVVNKEDLNRIELFKLPTNIVAKVIKKTSFEGINFDNSTMFQDWNISAKIFRKINKFYFTNRVTYLYKIRINSISNSSANTQQKLALAENSIKGIISFYNGKNLEVESRYLLIIKVKFYFNLIMRISTINNANLISKARQEARRNILIKDVFTLAKVPKLFVMYLIMQNHTLTKGYLNVSKEKV